MNVLVTGGNGRMARHLKSNDNLTYYSPGRDEMELGSYDSIDEYLENKNIDGLVLNAFQYLPGEVTLENFRHVDKDFLKATQVNLLSTLYLYLKLKNSLKFIIFLSTGLDPVHETNHIFYRNNKANLGDLLQRINCVEEKVKTVFVHPGHMHDDYTFKQSAVQVTKMIENLDRFKNLGTYGIFEKDKMEYRELESIKSYHTLNTFEL